MPKWHFCAIIVFTFTNIIYMNLVCPECKNHVDLTSYPDLDVGHVIECEMCGISLEINNMDDDKVKAEVVDEGK